MTPVCTLALLPFSTTLSFHLNVLNSLLIAVAALISALVSGAIFCFLFSSESVIEVLVANISSKRAEDSPISTKLSWFPQESVEGKKLFPLASKATP